VMVLFGASSRHLIGHVGPGATPEGSDSRQG